jgi:plastocyanin
MPSLYVYSPPQTEIARTGTVRFNFPPEEHNVVFQDRVAGTPDDIPITKSNVVPRQFNVAGSFNYYCTLHPQMVGLVIVH